ncbi:MAG: phage major capsid protein [Actinobacteria bacterium]|nr:MAG: phage major capsid protein [Actinomycetota bacterium]
MSGTATLATVEASLKTYYLPGLRWQADYASELAAIIEKTDKYIESDKVKFAAGYGATAGIGARSATGTLPTPGERKVKQIEFETKNLFVSIAINDKLIITAQNDARSFVNWWTDYMTHVEQDFRKDVARQYHGATDGSGKIATITAVTYAAGPPKTLTLTVNNAVFFEVGMLLDIIDASATPDAVLSGASGLEITAVDEENNQIVVSGIASDISGTIELSADYLVRSGNLNYEITGLAKVFTSDNTLYDLDRSVYKWFNPTTYNVGGEITEIKFQAALDKCVHKTNSRINALVTTDGVMRAFQAHMDAKKTIIEPMQLAGGYKVLSYIFRGTNLALISDIFCASGTAYGLNTETWARCRQAPLDWVDRDGSIWHRSSDDTPTWKAWGREYCELVCFQPRANVKLYGITEH